MTVYTVQPGDTIETIAEKFNVPSESLLQQNITQPDIDLVVGQNLVSWQLPYVDNESQVNALSNTSSINLADFLGVDFQFDEETQTPYFYYTINGREYFVWFKDAKTIISILDLVYRYQLRGVSIWSIMDYEPQIWTIINSEYRVTKLFNDVFSSQP